MLMINLNKMNTCTTRVVYHTKIKQVAVMSTSAIRPAGLGHRLPTLRSALKVPGTGVLRTEFGSVGPRLRLGILPIFLGSRGVPRLLSTTQCSFVISTVSALDPGYCLVCRTLRHHVGVMSDVKTNTGDSVARIHFTSL